MSTHVGRISEGWVEEATPVRGYTRNDGTRVRAHVREIDAVGRLASGESTSSVVKDIEKQLYDAKSGEVFDVSGVRVEKVIRQGKPFQPGMPAPMNHLVKHPGTNRVHGDFPSMAAGSIVQQATEKAAAANAPRPEPKSKGKKNVLQHRLPDGTVETRRTTHAYTHVVTTTGPALPFNDFWRTNNGRRRVVSWHASQANAEKALAQKQKLGYRAISIEPVNGGE